MYRDCFFLLKKIAVTFPLSPATLFHSLHQESHSNILSASCTLPQMPSINPPTMIPHSHLHSHLERNKISYYPIDSPGIETAFLTRWVVVTRKIRVLPRFRSSTEIRLSAHDVSPLLEQTAMPRSDKRFPGRLDVARNYHGVRKSGRPSPFYDFNDFN